MHKIFYLFSGQPFIYVFQAVVSGMNSTHLRPVSGEHHYQPVTGGTGVVEEGVEGIPGVFGHVGAGSFP